MTPPLDIAAGDLQARILPKAGGGLALFDRRGASGWEPVLRPYTGSADMPDAAMALALNVLVPFSNRLSEGVTGPDGTRHPVAPNLATETYPIHGDGWLSPWQVVQSTPNHARLAHSGKIGPWRYDATLDYRIENGSLWIDLAAVNTGPSLPFGLGLHPWFIRRPGTTLHAPASAQWLEGPGHLPIARIDISDPRAFDASAPTLLPDGWINAGFDGWPGRATLSHPNSTGVEIEVTHAAPLASRYVLFSPAANSDFVCVEPVTHAVDAPALPGGAAAHGMPPLATGARARLSCRLTPFGKDML